MDSGDTSERGPRMKGREFILGCTELGVLDRIQQKESGVAGWPVWS